MSYQDLDFKSRHAPPGKRPGRRFYTLLHLSRIARGLGVLVALVGALYLILSVAVDSTARVEDSNLKPQRLHYPVSLPDIQPTTLKALPPIEESTENKWITQKVKSGDTLASIFSDAGLNATTTYNVASLNAQTKKLTDIRPGQTVSMLLDENKSLISLRYQPDITQTLVIKNNQDGVLSSELQHHPLDAIPVFKSGTISSSLFLAAAENDISENIIMELAGIFGWDIDFSLDIRKGDRFGIVYNELYKDGVKIRDGRILSAEFINQGKKFSAVYYTDPRGESGYFSPDGKSMRKAFLRSPVEFSRISSRFTNKRWHPVLSKWRSHKGVDYAASRGTPIRASGDGKVSFKGTKGGYGKTIILQHGGKYTTLYAHMSRYASGIRAGKRVKQGQVIGYIGSTGLASGPHLHYEFRVNGVHRNPLRVKLPAAEPVDTAFEKHFENETRAFLSMLDLMNDNPVARVIDES